MKILFGVDDLVYENDLHTDIEDGEWMHFSVDFVIKDGVLYVDLGSCITTGIEAQAEELRK